MKAGVHCSVRNGFASALEEAARLGCETLQIFPQSHRDWKTRVYTDDDYNLFRKTRRRLGIGPVVVHTPYLPNLCTLNESVFKRSCAALRQDLDRCARLGAEYYIIHPGAFSPGSSIEKGIERLVSGVDTVLENDESKVIVLIENVAGGGRRIGGRFEELAHIINGVRKKERMGICFDTCHAYGAGFDLSTEKGVMETMEAFDHIIGLDRLPVFHVNDSEGTLGSRLDLHHHLGQGFIGHTGFRALFSRPEFKDRTFILETPRDPYPQADHENIQTLRSYFQ